MGSPPVVKGTPDVTQPKVATTMPKDKAALASALGLDPARAAKNPLFNQVYKAIKEGKNVKFDGVVYVENGKMSRAQFDALLTKLSPKVATSDTKWLEFQSAMVKVKGEAPKPREAGTVKRVDLKPSDKIPKLKIALACILGVDPKSEDSFFLAVYQHLKAGTTLKIGGKVYVEKGTMTEDQFRAVLEKCGKKTLAGTGDGGLISYNFKMVLGNQGRSGPNVTDLPRILMLYQQCAARVKSGDGTAKQSQIRQAMVSYLTMKDVKFVVVKGNGQMAKGFLKYYVDGTNKQFDSYMIAIMKEYGLNTKDELIANIDALKALDAYIGQMLLQQARHEDGPRVRQRWGTGKREDKVIALFGEPKKPNVSARMGAAFAKSFATGGRIDTDWVDGPSKGATVIEDAAERILGKMPDAQKAQAAKRLEVPVSKLSSAFREKVWKSMTDGQRREIELRLQKDPYAAEIFGQLIQEYLETGQIGSVYLGDLAKRQLALDTKLKALNKSALPEPQKTQERKRITEQLKPIIELQRRLKAMQKDPAKAFYSCFLGRHKDKMPKTGSKTLAQYRRDQMMAGFANLGRSGAPK